MERLTPLTAAFAQGPYPYYRQLVAQRPLYFDGEIAMWVASGAAAVDAVLEDAALGVRPGAQPVPPAMLGSGLAILFSRLARMTDGAYHEQRKAEIAFWIREHEQSAYPIAFEAAAKLANQLDNDARSANHYLYDAPASAMAHLAGVRDDAQTRQAIHDLALAIGRSANAAALARGTAAAEYLPAMLPAQSEMLAANILGLFFSELRCDGGAVGIAARRFARSHAGA
jgi:hypothetical protein